MWRTLEGTPPPTRAPEPWALLPRTFAPCTDLEAANPRPSGLQGWLPWASPLALHRENLAMRGASWLVANVVNWAQEVT